MAAFLFMRSLIVFTLFITGSTFVNGQSTDALPEALGEAYVAVCEKIQSCARVEFSLGDIPAEHTPVLEAALESLCSGVYQSIERLAHYPELEAPALMCSQSLLQLSCDSLASDQRPDSCTVLIEHAEHLGLTLN